MIPNYINQWLKILYEMHNDNTYKLAFGRALIENIAFSQYEIVEDNVVIDFLDFCAFPKIWPWVFNVADSFVCVGAGILMVWCVVSIVNETKLEKQKKLEAQAAPHNDGEENDGE